MRARDRGKDEIRVRCALHDLHLVCNRPPKRARKNAVLRGSWMKWLAAETAASRRRDVRIFCTFISSFCAEDRTVAADCCYRAYVRCAMIIIIIPC